MASFPGHSIHFVAGLAMRHILIAKFEKTGGFGTMYATISFGARYATKLQRGAQSQ